MPVTRLLQSTFFSSPCVNMKAFSCKVIANYSKNFSHPPKIFHEYPFFSTGLHDLINSYNIVC